MTIANRKNREVRGFVIDVRLVSTSISATSVINLESEFIQTIRSNQRVLSMNSKMMTLILRRIRHRMKKRRRKKKEITEEDR